MRIECRTELIALIDRQIGHDESCDLRIHGRAAQERQPQRKQRIQIAHEDHRHAELQRREFAQDPAQAHALRQRRAARALDGDAIGHRIGEWHADFYDVDARRHRLQVLAETLAAGVAGRHESDERGTAARVGRADRAD